MVKPWFNQAFGVRELYRTNVALIEVSGYSQQSTGQITIGLSCTSVHGQDNAYVARFNKQLLDEAFVISGIIKVEVSVISRSRRLRLITLTETLIIPDITNIESNNCFIILYLQVFSQFLAGSMKRIEKPFLLRCPRT